MNYDNLALKPYQDYPDYIQAPHLLRFQRAGIIRLDKATNYLLLGPPVFAFLESIRALLRSVLPNSEEFSIKVRSDTELSAFLSTLRTVKALPLSLLLLPQATDCVFASHFVSRTDLLYEVIVAFETEFTADWFKSVAQKLCDGCFVQTYSGFRMLESEYADYYAPCYDNTQFDYVQEQREVETPATHTIQELADYLQIDKRQTLKAVFYEFYQRLVFVYIRGDLDVDEQKLFHYIGGVARPALPELIEKHGFVPGYAGWHAVRQERGVVRILDESVRNHRNGVTGANKRDFHIIGYNLYDYIKAPDFVDIAVTYYPFKGVCYMEFERNIYPFELVAQNKVRCYSGVLKVHVLEILASSSNYVRYEDYFAVMCKDISTEWMKGVIDARPKVSLSYKIELAKLGMFARCIVVGREFLNSGQLEVFCGDFSESKLMTREEAKI